MTNLRINRAPNLLRATMATFLVAVGLTVLPASLAARHASAAPAPLGHPGMGFLWNFDVYNTTDRTCQGFDLQIEDVTVNDVPYQYWGAYPQPSLTPMSFPDGHSGIDVRWESSYTAGLGWAYQTPVGGIEHFGASSNITPGPQHLSWVCDDPSNPGHPAAYGGTSTGNGYVDNTISPAPTVATSVAATASGIAVQQVIQNGPAPAPGQQSPLDAVWYLRYSKSSPDVPALSDLTPDNAKYALSTMTQSQINDAMNLVDGGKAEAAATATIGSGDKSSVWVVQEFAYTGPYDDAHTALCNETPGDPNNCANFVGDLLSTTVLDTALAKQSPVAVKLKTNGASSGTGGSVSSNDLVAAGTGLANIDCGSTCSTVVDNGTTVTLTEHPNAGYSFTGWSGACTGSSSTCTVTAAAAATVTASFTQGLSLTVPANPPKVIPRGTVKVSLKGTGFGKGTTATVSGSGVTVSGTTVTGKTNAATITFTAAASAGADPGLRDVTITTTDQKTYTCTSCLQVGAIPSITSVNPSSRARGTTLPVSLSGSGFTSGLHVYVSGGGFMVKNLVTTPTLITFNLQISPGATPGLRTIQVKNPDGGIGTASITFT